MWHRPPGEEVWRARVRVHLAVEIVGRCLLEVLRPEDPCSADEHLERAVGLDRCAGDGFTPLFGADGGDDAAAGPPVCSMRATLASSQAGSRPAATTLAPALP